VARVESKGVRGRKRERDTGSREERGILRVFSFSAQEEEGVEFGKELGYILGRIYFPI